MTGNADPNLHWDGQRWLRWDGQAWLPDPDLSPAVPIRHWDGQQWLRWSGAAWLPETVPAVAPAPSAVAPEPASVVADARTHSGGKGWVPRHKVATAFIAVFAGLILIGAVGAVFAPPSAPAAGQTVAAVGHTAPTTSSTSSSPTSTASSPSGSSVAPSPAGSAPTAAKAGSALAALGTLPVKGRAPMTGYSRTAFGPAWEDVDHNGCDTRNDILRRDLTARVMAGACVVSSGTLHDPYTATFIHFVRGVGTSTKVQIDHVVALGDAWQTGAQQLNPTARLDLANDPLELLAVDGPTNERKGDGDAATWLPPNKAFRCQYVARQVAVKVRYHLWVTPAEKDAIARVLATCPNQTVATGGSPLVAGASASAKATSSAPRPSTSAPAAPKTSPPPATTPPTATYPTVHPGAYCSPPGAYGVTTKGTLMVCKLDSKGVRYRWGAA